ncbi:MAG: hypothetical protein VYA34_04720 [Myxococcota bacterium]|nr:hypothetical protein [Myxococcota bacterium]
MVTYERRCPLQAGAPQVFSWHKRPGAFGRLTPPWPKLVLLKQSGTIHNDDSLVFGIQIGPFMLQWHTNHSNYAENVLFVDTQTKGPFKSWKHEHHFIPRGSNHSEIVDKVICSLPFSFLSEPVLGPFLKRRLDLLFHHRHKQLQSDMGRHQAYTTQPKLKVAITGTNGLVGGALFDFLSTGGHSVYKLLRNPTQTDTNSIFWDPSEGIIESDRLENLDAIIHLGGHNIAAGRWTPAEKEKIRTSRIQSTQLLADTIHILKSPPKIFMVASAIGY